MGPGGSIAKEHLGFGRCGLSLVGRRVSWDELGQDVPKRSVIVDWCLGGSWEMLEGVVWM
jgi:hypothetical protein